MRLFGLFDRGWHESASWVCVRFVAFANVMYMGLYKVPIVVNGVAKFLVRVKHKWGKLLGVWFG